MRANRMEKGKIGGSAPEVSAMALQFVLITLTCADWLFPALFPLAEYTALSSLARAAHSRGHLTLFVPAANMLLLLLIGIHNAYRQVAQGVVKLPEPPRQSRGLSRSPRVSSWS